MRKQLLAACVTIGVLAVMPGSEARNKKKTAATTSAPQMDSSKRIVHMLNRFTFGARPADVERVQEIGIDKWFEQQLEPEKIDDSALAARLAPYRTLNMSPRELVENFPPPQILKAIADGRMQMPSDPDKRAIYEAEMEQYRERLQAKSEKVAETKSQPAINKNANADPAMMPAQTAPDGDRAMNTANAARKDARLEGRMYADLDFEKFAAMPAPQRFTSILDLPPAERRAMATGLNENDRDRLVDGMTPEQKETLVALVNPQLVVGGELTQAKLLRAVYSERQLQEVMTDFWFNHFNVFFDKGADRYLVTSYERDAIRPHALGKFKDLLMATATSPAMLFYLDNVESVGPDSQAATGRPLHPPQRPQWRRRQQRPFAMGGSIGMRFPQNRFPQNGPGGQRPRRQNANRANNKGKQPKVKRGLNENYARELMELQTLGVDGGYTQKDVTELAKVLTGWTVREPLRGGEFQFNDRMHEPGDKYVLGHKIAEDGQNEGIKMLDILAHHPSTAHFISKKLAMRFVSDDPPPALVDRMAQTFLSSDGDIKAVLRTMFHSPEFWAPEAYRAKVKTPLEFVASAVRVTGSDVQKAMPLAQTLQKLGMPLYRMQPPTGYPMTATAWVNSAALLDRMNFALALGNGRLHGVNLQTMPFKDSSDGANSGGNGSDEVSSKTGRASVDDAINFVAAVLLNGDVSEQTRDVVRQQLTGAAAPIQNSASQGPDMAGNLKRKSVADRQLSANTNINIGAITGLLLGSPEFQRR